MLRTGALALSNCRLLRNGFVEIFKAAVKEAGIWLLEVRRQVGVIWAQTYLTPGCFWIDAFCRGLPSPRGLSMLWSKAGTQGHSCCVDLPCVLVKGMNSLCLARLVFFCTSLQADSVTGKAVFLGCFPPCSKQPPVVVEMQLSPCQASHLHHVLPDRPRGFTEDHPPPEVVAFPCPCSWLSRGHKLLVVAWSFCWHVWSSIHSISWMQI